MSVEVTFHVEVSVRLDGDIPCTDDKVRQLVASQPHDEIRRALGQAIRVTANLNADPIVWIDPDNAVYVADVTDMSPVPFTDYNGEHPNRVDYSILRPLDDTQAR